MSKDDKAIFYHKPQTFQWTPADGVFSFGENRKEQNMIRYYSVPKETFVTNGTIVEPLNVTENGTYAPPAGTAYSPVVVNVEGGGGGSSDFSTAEVTVNIIDFEEGAEVAFNDVPKVENGVLMSGDMYVITATETITVPLAPNGVTFGAMYEPQSITGSATVTQEGKDFIITVTGDSVLNYLNEK